MTAIEDLIFIRPTKEYEKQAYEYIQEFKDYNSEINGVGGLNRYLNNYDGWLKKLEEDRVRIPDEKLVPAETFMLIRKSDNKLIGIFNIRLVLNKALLLCNGNIGYGIRPTERRKGYASYGLYCALKFCNEIELEKVLVSCYKENIGSAKTIKSCYGVLENEIQEDDGKIIQRYWIDVPYALHKLKEKYEEDSKIK